MGIDWARIRSRKATEKLFELVKEEYPEVLVDFVLRYPESAKNLGDLCPKTNE